MLILSLHGPNSTESGKPTCLAQHGHTVLNPKLPDDDFDEAVRIAQEEFDRHHPDVVVGFKLGWGGGDEHQQRTVRRPRLACHRHRQRREVSEDSGEKDQGEIVMAANETIKQVPIKRLRPNPWGLEVGPPLGNEDYRALKASIRTNGIQIPLVVWVRGARLVVLSGSNRLRVAKELALRTVPVLVRQFADQHAAKMFAVSDNLARRQLTTGQRAYLAYQYQQLLSVGRGRRTELCSRLNKVNSWRMPPTRQAFRAGRCLP